MADKLEVAQKYINQGYRTRFVLRVCKIAKSTWYDFKKSHLTTPTAQKKASGRYYPGYSFNISREKVLDENIVLLLKNYRKQLYFMNAGGSKILHHYLKRDFQIIVNHKKINRLCKENGILLPRNQKKVRKNIKVCQNRKINRPNQLWQFDIKFGYVHGENNFFYLLAYIDVFTREIVGYYVGKHVNHQNHTFFSKF